MTGLFKITDNSKSKVRAFLHAVVPIGPTQFAETAMHKTCAPNDVV